jgi:hypothetical protein
MALAVLRDRIAAVKTFDEAMKTFCEAPDEIEVATFMEGQDEHLENESWVLHMQSLLDVIEEHGVFVALHLAFSFGQRIGMEMERTSNEQPPGPQAPAGGKE